MNLIEIYNQIAGKSIEIGIIVFLGMLGGLAQALIKIAGVIDDNFEKVTLLMIDKVGMRQKFEDKLASDQQRGNDLMIAKIERVGAGLQELINIMLQITTDPDVKKRFIETSKNLSKDN